MMARRIRSREIPSQTLPARVYRPGSVRRSTLDRGAAGPDEVAAGSIKARHMGGQAVQQGNQHPDAAGREVINWETPGDAIAVAESKPYVVQIGGELTSTWTVTGTVTSDIEVTIYRNGAALTAWDSVGETAVDDVVVISASPTYKAWSTVWRKGDLMVVGITDAGAGGSKLRGSCRINPTEA